MKITHIEIQNFRAFYGNFKISLDHTGKNLLLYGENGSGKSSLFYALKLFLQSANTEIDFSKHRNIFVTDEIDGFVKLTVGGNTYEWSANKLPNEQIILEANKTKGFLDYRDLLKTYFLHNPHKDINLFDLLVENLLADYIEPSSGRTIGDIWRSISEKSNAKKSTNVYKKELFTEKALMNDVLNSALTELQSKINELLDFFNYKISCFFHKINVTNKTIILSVKFFDKILNENHHNFLNEARLSAIALCIYFASILRQPTSQLSILALDDVLIGLDMSNRLPVIDILDRYFSNHQIFFITHDKLWFEMMKMRTSVSKWKYAEFYCNPNNGIELPVYVDNKEYLERAKEHWKANDYKAAAIYARTAFEVVLKEFCEAKDLKVKFRKDIKELESNDFWSEIKSLKKNDLLRYGKKKLDERDNFPFLNVSLIDEIELYRSLVLNPLSHSRIINIEKDEVNKAISAIEKLKYEIDNELGKNKNEEITAFHGIIIKPFFSDNPPPRFHVVYSKYKAFFDINGLEMIDGNLPDRAKDLVIEWATSHQTELLEMWTTQKFKKLPPLD